MVGETKSHNKTIFSLIENDDVLTEFHTILKEEGINFEEQGMGIMFTIPVDNVIR